MITNPTDEPFSPGQAKAAQMANYIRQTRQAARTSQAERDEARHLSSAQKHRT